jgi:hypothetical protein
MAPHGRLPSDLILQDVSLGREGIESAVAYAGMQERMPNIGGFSNDQQYQE